jgi:hypothetical protein
MLLENAGRSPEEAAFLAFMHDAIKSYDIRTEEAAGLLRIFPSRGSEEGFPMERIRDLAERALWNIEPMKYGLYSMSVLSKVGKMQCPGFNTPAGPFAIGGTCVAAAMAWEKRKVEYFTLSNKHVIKSMQDIRGGIWEAYKKGYPGRHGTLNIGTYICNSCYATGGNYRTPKIIMILATKHEWARRAMRQDSFVKEMSRAIELAVLKGKKVPDYWNTKYFRIHDSGDFFSEEYFGQWVKIAKKFPGIKFWAPVRMWILRPQLDKMLSRHPPPKNLILRPSLLHLDESPAEVRIEGLAAPTGVIKVKKDVKAKKTTYEKIPGVLGCPATLTMSDEPGAKTCEGQRCRVCWTNPEMPVFYAKH